MFISIEKQSKVPYHRQIVLQLQKLIHDGVLNRNEKLPSTRELANEIAVHRNTVLKAYEELISQGVLESKVGSGTFITSTDINQLEIKASADSIPSELLNWDVIIRSECKPDIERENVNRRKQQQADSTIILDRYISDPDLYPYEQIRKITTSILKRADSKLLKYGNPAGYPELREYLKVQAVKQGIDMNRNRIVIVNGSTQGLDLISRLVLNPGDGVALGIPCYTGIIRLFTIHGIRFISIPIKPDGIDVDVLEQVLNMYPVKMLYIIPNFHNPTGVTISLEKRKKIIELAQRYHIVILEDDFIYQLRFRGVELPSLKSLDTRHNVIYSGTFSKILFSGFRIGWLIVPEEIYANVLLVKTSLDISTNNLLQAVIYEYCQQGLLDKHLKKIKKITKERYEVTIESMKLCFPEETSWWQSDGGMGIWVNLPEGCDPLAVQQLAMERGVAVLATPFFVPRGEKNSGFWIGFAYQKTDNIKKGIHIVGEVISEMTQTNKPVVQPFHEQDGLRFL